MALGKKPRLLFFSYEGSIEFYSAEFQLKRRSGRHTKRKKYNDELDLELSDEDTMDAAPGEAEGAVVKPVQLFVVCMGSCLT